MNIKYDRITDVKSLYVAVNEVFEVVENIPKEQRKQMIGHTPSLGMRMHMWEEYGAGDRQKVLGKLLVERVFDLIVEQGLKAGHTRVFWRRKPKLVEHRFHPLKGGLLSIACHVATLPDDRHDQPQGVFGGDRR